MNLPEKSVLCPYLAPKPSRSLIAYLLGLHAAALLAAWLNPLSVWLKLPISLCVLMSLWLTYNTQANSPEIAGLQLKPDDTWLLRFSKGGDVEASLLGSSIANPWFVLLYFKADSKQFSLLMPRDSLANEDYRKLLVALKVIRIGEGQVDSNRSR